MQNDGRQGVLPPIASPKRPGRVATSVDSSIASSHSPGHQRPTSQSLSSSCTQSPSSDRQRLPPISNAIRVSSPRHAVGTTEETTASGPDSDLDIEKRRDKSANVSHGPRKMLADLAGVARLPIEQKLNRCNNSPRPVQCGLERLCWYSHLNVVLFCRHGQAIEVAYESPPKWFLDILARCDAW